MKKIILACFFTLLLIGAVGCQKSEDTNVDSITFTGTITSVEDTRIFVEADSQFDTVYINVPSETNVTLKDGSDGTIKDLNVGDEISVKFSGVATMSEPPQITATDIEVQ